jgi:hypothetical protein
MEMRIHWPSRPLADPVRRLKVGQPAIFTPRAEPKWFSNARLRTTPIATTMRFN